MRSCNANWPTEPVPVDPDNGPDPLYKIFINWMNQQSTNEAGKVPVGGKIDMSKFKPRRIASSDDGSGDESGNTGKGLVFGGSQGFNFNAQSPGATIASALQASLIEQGGLNYSEPSMPALAVPINVGASGASMKSSPALLPGSSNTLVPTAPTSIPSSMKIWTKVPQSWYDLPLKEPEDIRDLIANASLQGIPGNYEDSTTFSQTSGGAWNTSPLSLAGLPKCFTLGTDNQLLVSQAQQWNFKHLTANLSGSLSPLLTNVVYLRAGLPWLMSVPLNTSTQIDDVQLSFRNNAASYGEFTGGSTGTVPAISFTGIFTGALALNITLKKVGHAHLAFRMIDHYGNYSMFGLECIIVN